MFIIDSSYLTSCRRIPEPKPEYKRMTSAFYDSDSACQNPLRSSWNGSIASIKMEDYEHTIVHTGAITVMLNLLPSLDPSGNPNVSIDLLELNL